MKQLLFVSATLILLSVAFTGRAIAQTDPTNSIGEPHTLLDKRQVGIYVTPEFQYGLLGGNFTPMASYSLMLLFDQRFAIGASGGSSANTSLNATQPMQMEMSFVGLKAEYIFTPYRTLHLTVPVLIGAQMVQVNSTSSGAFSREHNSMFGHGNGFAFVQPALMLEANLASFAKIYLGASYRAALNAPDSYSIGSDSVKFGNSQASGIAFSAGLKLGWFNFHHQKFGNRHH